MSDDGDVGIGGCDEAGGEDVVGMGVAVGHVGDWKRGYCADVVEEIGADCWRSVDDDHAGAVGDGEEGLVASIGDHVGSIAEGLDAIAKLRWNRRTDFSGRDGEVRRNGRRCSMSRRGM